MLGIYGLIARLRRGTQMAVSVSIRGYVRLEANGQPRSRPHVRLELPQQYESGIGSDTSVHRGVFNDKGVEKWYSQSRTKITSLAW
jgi:hypothetical protein